MSEMAARVALASVAFSQHGPPMTSPASWWLFPDHGRQTYPEVVAALLVQPKPLVVAALARPGALAVWPLAAVQGRARARMDHEWRNQQAAVEECLEGYGLGPADPILLEFEADELRPTGADLVEWGRAYLVLACGWRMTDTQGDPRARGRLLFMRPDGLWSPGDYCPVRHPAT